MAFCLRHTKRSTLCTPPMFELVQDILIPHAWGKGIISMIIMDGGSLQLYVNADCPGHIVEDPLQACQECNIGKIHADALLPDCA